jgi:uncharacterized protein (TIGR02598 family)
MNKLPKKRGFGTGGRGFSLVEVCMAIAVVAFTFITLIGLLALGVGNDQKSFQQTVATNIVASIVADLRSTPNFSYANGSAVSTRYQITLPTPSTTPNTSAKPLSGVTPVYIYFDDNQNALETTPLTSATPPSGAVYLATIYLASIVSVGPTAGTSTPTYLLTQTTHIARVVVSWPALAQAAPAGSVDVVTEFRLH